GAQARPSPPRGRSERALARMLPSRARDCRRRSACADSRCRAGRADRRDKRRSCPRSRPTGARCRPRGAQPACGWPVALARDLHRFVPLTEKSQPFPSSPRTPPARTGFCGLYWVSSPLRGLGYATLMKQQDCGSIPVVDGGRLVGIVTDRDIVVRAVAAGKDPKTLRVTEVMSADPITVGPDEDVKRAEKVMADRQIRRLPVVENG